ncbi:MULTISPECIES: hypothetical protein [Streptomyces]|uniref:hypothetical protein n=1 Tax=Streptomyces TaxID=1883 RepID=UPI00344A3108
MSTTAAPPHPDASALNAAIRTFLSARRGRALSGSERSEYEALRARWVAAVRAGFETAA